MEWTNHIEKLEQEKDTLTAAMKKMESEKEKEDVRNYADGMEKERDKIWGNAMKEVERSKEEYEKKIQLIEALLKKDIRIHSLSSLLI